MKKNDIVELIIKKDYGKDLSVGDFGIVKKKDIFDYVWVVDFVDLKTKQKIKTASVREEDLIVHKSFPSKKNDYTDEQLKQLEQVSINLAKQLRNFQEFDVIEVIRDRPEYAKYGVYAGCCGSVLFEYEFKGKVGVLINDFETWEDYVDISVRREDLRKLESWPSEQPQYTEEEKQELIKLSDKLKEEYNAKDEERRKKFGY